MAQSSRTTKQAKCQTLFLASSRKGKIKGGQGTRFTKQQELNLLQVIHADKQEEAKSVQAILREMP